MFQMAPSELYHRNPFSSVGSLVAVEGMSFLGKIPGSHRLKNGLTEQVVSAENQQTYRHADLKLMRRQPSKSAAE